MAKTATVRARLEPTLKAEAEGVLEALGLNPTAAITLYYEQIALRHGLPFEVSLPNAATRRAMDDAKSGRSVTRARNAADLFALLERD